MASGTSTYNLEELADRLRAFFTTDARYQRLAMSIEPDPFGGPGQSLVLRDGSLAYLVAHEDGDIRTGIADPAFVDVLGSWKLT